ncbi:MAG TPA: hypothetical protein VGG30_05820 [Pirellulales bacterium]
MNILRIEVERVVRPIRARYERKDRMREELLAHLTQLYEQELTRCGDAESATSEAICRFGDARALSRELQASVPWLERWAFIRFPVYGPTRRRRGESPLRYMLRLNSWGLAIGIPCYALIALVVGTIASCRPHRADQVPTSQVFVSLACFALLQFVGMIGLGLLSEGIRQELERFAAAATAVERRKATWRIVGYAAAGSAWLGGTSAGVMLLFEAFIPVPFITRPQFWWITMGAVALGPLFILKHAIDWKASARRFEHWESLDLDEHEAVS